MSAFVISNSILFNPPQSIQQFEREIKPMSEPVKPQPLFSGQPQHEVFARMRDLYTTSEMAASTSPYEFPDGKTESLPQTYRFEGTERSTEQFLVDTDTAALLVLRDGAICYERYLLTGAREVNWMSFSVAKSFLSALIGIAVEEGRIGSIEDAITAYVPMLAGSAYDGVSIKNVLQMASGARWNEDYSDPESDIHGYNAVLAGEG